MQLDQIKGIGNQLINKFMKLNIHSVSDLLFHLPRDYQDRTKLNSINLLSFDQMAQIEGIIVNAQVIKARSKRLKLTVKDHSQHTLEVIFFHFFPNQIAQLRKGQKIQLYGQVKIQSGSWQMIHPEYKLLYPNKPHQLPDRLTPIYPATEGLSSQMIAKYIRIILEDSNYHLDDILPNWLIQQYHLKELDESLHFIHHPPKTVDLNRLKVFQYAFQRRLIIEELIAHRLSIQLAKTNNQKFNSHVITSANRLKEFIQNLAFQPTKAQYKVIEEIQSDLKRPTPMARLVQGDVGSGKTIVAAAAALLIAENNRQTALMAPTEILAEQHYHNFCLWFDPLAIKCALITNKTTKKQRKIILDELINGQIDILIGTHAVFQDNILFKQLALVIIDEQHRFGVQQRYDLLNKGKIDSYSPHQLVMSATPIPRTLTMAVYGDLDVSIIDELPKGRAGIQTAVLSNQKRNDLINKLKTEFNEGTQAYWVCPLIEESDALSELQAAENTLELLKHAFNDINVALIHGKMKAKNKIDIMQRFKAGDIQLLVATTVIEVGVDVANASIMVIENPERLGLSQLHQLRGRVGRGKLKGTCILLYHPPLSQTAKERLDVMRRYHDGFIIAEKDLSIRGPGELLGTKQTGNITFRVADLIRDRNQLTLVEEISDQLLAKEPNLVPQLIQRWLGDGIKFKQA
ncbi:ATP-dependent DNA helicase RecG [Thiotrichales bacterium 19S3-7]|nr:ATP-dependent DNA helicase RecG [Thiotrichales bacterium 19S3-7]MCF6801150.1 ATP-dependent DNA helicase RecG [Thiotrichales bacterium 19S3-11]